MQQKVFNVLCPTTTSGQQAAYFPNVCYFPHPNLRCLDKTLRQVHSTLTGIKAGDTEQKRMQGPTDA